MRTPKNFIYLCEIQPDDLKLSSKLERDNLLNWWKEKAVKTIYETTQEQSVKTIPLWYEDLNKKSVQGWLYARGINYV